MTQTIDESNLVIAYRNSAFKAASKSRKISQRKMSEASASVARGSMHFQPTPVAVRPVEADIFSF